MPKARPPAPRQRPSSAEDTGARVEPATSTSPQASPARPPSEPSAASNAPPFLVAGVGASAGGLEALSGLLRAIPADAPLALVVVQHLARNQPSILPELLSHATPLNVRAAHDELELKPGNVYVIPPDARMTVADGHLRVRPAAAQREREGTVDLLFRSMAREYSDRAVGVVLSGSAQDGAAGLREIKSVGGVGLVQTPEEAAVDGMPRAAMAAGSVDAILPVAEIGAHLDGLARRPLFLREGGDEAALPDEGTYLHKVFKLLQRATGVDFGNYKLPTLRRRIERRMAMHRAHDLGAYVALLEREPSELLRLQEELLIHVTSFFRDPASYAALTEVIFPRLLANVNDGTSVRCWVPGCSTGEEVYSLAITIFEFLGDRAHGVRLQIFGTDVSDVMVVNARAGVYGEAIANEVSPERLRRFFTAFEGGYRINKEVRDRCIFARQDVVRDPPFSRQDLIVCRNLLIYFKPATQRRVLDTFHYALSPGGVLVLGRAESVASDGSPFSMIHKQHRFYAKKSDRAYLDVERVTPIASPPVATPQVGERHEPPHPALPSWDGQNDANRFLIDHYAPPALLVDNQHRILRSRGTIGPFLEWPSGEMTTDVLKLARPSIAHALRSALREAQSSGAPTTQPGLHTDAEDNQRLLNIHVVPLGPAITRQFLIVFENGGNNSFAPIATAEKRRPHADVGVQALDRELMDARSQLQGIIDDLGAANEELQSANEEILSSNEEMQSTNEELNTAREEQQSTNEELTTLNDELKGRNDELAKANSDLLNVLASIQVPIVMVTRELRIRRFTPAAEKTMNLIPSDVGRPIGHLKPNLVCPDLESWIAQVIDDVTVVEREVEGTDGKLFNVQIRPYKSVENKIEGAVIAMLDVSTLENQAAALEVATATGEALMSTVREPILLLRSDLIVLKTNQAFREKFHVETSDSEGRSVFDLGNGQWDIPALRRLLLEVLPGQKNFEAFEVEHEFPNIGRKRMLLDARRIESGRRKQGVLLLVIRDVTGHAK